MLTAETKKKYTVADYMQLEEGAPFQLINYELIMSPSPTPLHQGIVARISQLILNFLDINQLQGYVGGSVDVIFDDGNVYQPDVVFVSEERTEKIVKDRLYGAPDFAIEILSPSNAYYDLRKKKAVYEKFGVNEYIIIDPMEQTAEGYLLSEGQYVLHQKALQPDGLVSITLPGLVFELKKLFS
jgi:Uma2 family endonuclease